MKQNQNNPLERLAGRDGMTVPEGYFADFARRMAAELPPRPEIEDPSVIQAAQLNRSFWQRVRPYAYMAAMFAGIWLMLQLFGLFSKPVSLSPMESNPVLAEAFMNDDFVSDYFIGQAGMDEWDVLDDMISDGTIKELDPSTLVPSNP